MVNWIELLVAVISASLIGSLHCVGMCGPFAMIATNRGSNEAKSRYARVAGYHLGRLTTYFILGTMVGVASSLMNRIGETMGFGQMAARLVGMTMIALGVLGLIRLARKRSPIVSHSNWLHAWTRRITAIGKKCQPSSLTMRAYVIGLITTWLPCGWLYLFALAASGTGSVIATNAMMLAFWLGTLPLLSLVAIGSQALSRGLSNQRPRWAWLGGSNSAVPLQGLAAGVLIAFGAYTYFQRGQTQLDSLVVRHQNGIFTRASIRELADEPLPCCQSDSTLPTRNERTVLR